MISRVRLVAPALAAASISGLASASIVLPAIETFDAGAASWFDGSSVAELDWVAAGGIDGSGYVTDTIDLPSSDHPAVSIEFVLAGGLG